VFTQTTYLTVFNFFLNFNLLVSIVGDFCVIYCCILWRTFVCILCIELLRWFHYVIVCVSSCNFMTARNSSRMSRICSWTAEQSWALKYFENSCDFKNTFKAVSAYEVTLNFRERVADRRTSRRERPSVKRCLPVSPKPVSPKLGFRVRVRVAFRRIGTEPVKHTQPVTRVRRAVDD